MRRMWGRWGYARLVGCFITQYLTSGRDNSFGLRYRRALPSATTIRAGGLTRQTKHIYGRYCSLGKISLISRDPMS